MNGPKRVLITGADGFIGRALAARLSSAGCVIRSATWEPSSLESCFPAGFGSTPAGWENVVVGDIGPDTTWAKALRGVDAIIHLAARVHVMDDTSDDPLADYRRVNTCGTRQLACCAAEAGVERLVYVSTVKVNGERTNGRGAFSESDEPDPSDPYAISKWEAEQALRQVSQESELEVVIVRPPLVYGPGVRANFFALLKLAYSGWPLPLGRIRNRRSLIYIENLCDFLLLCSRHQRAAGETFLASDGDDLSTPELVRRMAKCMARPTRLVNVPEDIIRFGCRLLNKANIAERLLGSLEVNCEKARRLTGWAPPASVDEGLAKTCAWFLQQLGRRGAV